MRRFVRKHAVALIAIAAYHFVFFFPVLFMSRVVSPNDVFWNTEPWAAVRHVDVQNSQLNDPPTSYLTLIALLRSDPRAFHWNPYVASGIPGWGSSAAAVLSPFILLPALIVPWAWIWTAILFLKINASFYFAYLWLREERLGKRGAAIGAIVFAAAGPFAVRWMWQVTNATVLYPALLWIACRTTRGKRTPVSVVALIALAYALAGFPAAMAYGAWVAGVYFVARFSWRRSLAALGMTGVGVLIAIAIALPSLIPMIQFVRRTGYLGARADAAVQNSFPRSEWRSFIQPNRLGNPAYHNWVGDRQLRVLNNYVETTVYLGLLTIPLVLLSIARRRWFWIVAMAVILACMFGAPGIAPLVAKLPGFKYSSLSRLQLILPIAVAYLAAAGATVIARRRWIAVVIALIIAGDLGVFAGRFYPYLPPSETFIPRTPTMRFVQNDVGPFRVAPFMNYLWPNSAELFRIEDVRSHFSSEAMYRRLLQRIDPTSFGGYSTVIQFDSRSFNFADPLVGMLGIRYFLEHKSIDIIRWGIYSKTVPGVKEVGAIRLDPTSTFRRTLRVDAEPFYAIELPVSVDETTTRNPRLYVTLLKGTTSVVWRRVFTPDDLDVMHKVYIPLRPYARLGESVTLIVRSSGIRGSVLRGEGAAPGETPLFYGRVTTPVIFDRELPDGRIFRNVAEVPRFHGVASLRKMSEEQFLAAKDVDFEREAIITDPAAPLPETSDASVKLIRYAEDEQVLRGSGVARYFIASSEKLTPELRVTIDGRAAKPITINGLFAGVSVPAGDHTIVFSREIARGWWWVSILGVIAFVVAALPATSALTAKELVAGCGDENDLVGEEGPPEACDDRQDLLAEAEDRLRRPVADDQADRNRGAAHGHDAEAGALQLADDRPFRVEAEMRVIEDSSVAVFENAEQQAEADGDVGDVRDGDEEEAVIGERGADEGEHGLRIAEVLEDVGEDDGVEARRKVLHRLEVGDDGLVEVFVQCLNAVGVVLESERAAEMIADGRSELAAGGAEVEEAAAALRVAAEKAEEDTVAAPLEVLERIDVRHASVLRPGFAGGVAAGGAAVDVDDARGGCGRGRGGAEVIVDGDAFFDIRFPGGRGVGDRIDGNGVDQMRGDEVIERLRRMSPLRAIGGDGVAHRRELGAEQGGVVGVRAATRDEREERDEDRLRSAAGSAAGAPAASPAMLTAGQRPAHRPASGRRSEAACHVIPTSLLSPSMKR